MLPLHYLKHVLDFIAEPDHTDLHYHFYHGLTTAQSRLEAIIRDSLAANDHDRIAKIVHQLCHDYAYAVHQPHARNGGLIGLAAAAIALGGVHTIHPTEYVQPLTPFPRKSPAIYEKSSPLSSPAFPIRMLECDTMPARACTT